MATNVSNLFRSTIDLDTPEGKKMISKMVAGLADEEQFDMKREIIVEFRNNLEEAVNRLYLGNDLYVIPITRDNNRVVLKLVIFW